MQSITLSRHQLYEAVWQTPMLTLAKKYSITDNGLRKICKRLNIPLPKAGHWQKIQFGKKVNQIPLAAFDGKETSVTLKPRSEESAAQFGQPSAKKLKTNEITEALSDTLIVTDNLRSPHSLIKDTKDYLQSKERYINNGLIVPHQCINIRVSKKSQHRALCIMNALIKLLEKRGHSILVQNDKTFAVIYEQKVEIALREKLKATRDNSKLYANTTYEPTAVLVFKMDSFGSKEWIDGKLPLENQLATILVRLELKAEEYKQHAIASAIRHEEYERARAIRLQFGKNREDDFKEFLKTLHAAERWHKTENLRAYIQQVETRAIEASSLSPELASWIIRARQQADWYDPFINADDEQLQGIDKTTLNLPKSYY